MNFEPTTEIQCPYCAEVFTAFVDLSQGSSSYIEDCQVCCQPIRIELQVGDLEQEEFQVSVSSET